MKKYILLVTFLSIFVFSCLLIIKNEININDKNERGEQIFEYIGNLSIIDIYNVLKNKYLDYDVELFYIPESSPFQIEDRTYIMNRQMLNLNSERYWINISQYSIDYDENNGVICILYSLKGENKNKRKLIEPMEKIKQCLFSDFSKYLNVNNFTEIFTSLPMR